MAERRVERTNALTVDHLTARLEAMERAFAALQQAYVELQAVAREREQVAPGGAILADGPDVDTVPRIGQDPGGPQYVA